MVKATIKGKRASMELEWDMKFIIVFIVCFEEPPALPY